MSYDRETAEKPLTGETFDILILQEREQQHLIGRKHMKGYVTMPAAEYCELRDMYKRLVQERDGNPEEPGEMSIEQAIAILNPKTSRAALYAYQYYGGFRGGEAQIAACEEACRVAVRVMRKSLSAEAEEEKR